MDRFFITDGQTPVDIDLLIIMWTFLLDIQPY
jgi:hypothetical protein